MGNSNKNKKSENSAIQINYASNVDIRGSMSHDYSMIGSNDSLSRIKQSLKYLHKNNFSSLTFEDLNAYFIQLTWKQHIIIKNRDKRKGIIDVIYSSIEKNANVTSRQERLFVNLDSKRHPYRCYDLMNYKSLKKVVEKYGGYDNLPAIFINNIFIGSADNFQEMEDLRLTNNIVTKEYLKRCLICNIVKLDMNLVACPYCFKNYTFFAKNDLLIDIYKNRRNESDLIY